MGSNGGGKRGLNNGEDLVCPEAKRGIEQVELNDSSLDSSLATVFHMGEEGMNKSGKKRSL